MIYFSAFILAVLISAVATGFLRRLGIKHNLVAVPRARDIHKTPIPRIGGGAIFLAFVLTSIIFFEIVKTDLSFGGLRGWLSLDWRFVGIIVGSALVFSTILFDDLRGLKVWQKLLIQFLAAVVVIASGIGIDTLSNPFGAPLNLNSLYIPLFTFQGITYHFSVWSDLLTLSWLMIMMNVMNLVDGVDGLASGLSGIASITIFLLCLTVSVNQPATALISIILAGASIGFLFWNFPPAKIFMGDAGSMFLGFMLGVLPLISGGKLATAFLVLGFPILDVFVVAIGRMLKGKNPLTTPDRTHLHHRFLEAGFSPREAVLTLYLVAIVSGWVALRSSTAEKLAAAIMLVVLIVVLIIFLEKRKKSLSQR
ncbi:MAG: MraY family glycosyltransferase [Candidatus Berkelbacteria bacterium]|nr:MraY family glycosyltransferase [Candidatus Berkelbacteria bacterium]